MDKKPVLGENENSQVRPEGISDEEWALYEKPQNKPIIEDKPKVKEEKKPEDPEDKENNNLEPVDPRSIYTMPVSKAQKQKEKAVAKVQVEYETKIKELEEQLKKKKDNNESTINVENNISDELKKYADEVGADSESLNKLLSIFQKNIKTPDLSKFESLLQSQKIAEEKTSVAHDIEDKVLPKILKDYPDASIEFINKIKTDIATLAFTEKYHTYDVNDIYLINKSNYVFQNKHSIENSNSRSNVNVDLKDISEEEAIKLGNDKYIEWQDLQRIKQFS